MLSGEGGGDMRESLDLFQFLAFWCSLRLSVFVNLSLSEQCEGRAWSLT